jgi:glycosyltransferase involved in cell wall biosynthesis
MKIAIVTSSYPRAGNDPAGHFVAAEVKELIRNGHELCVFAPGTGYESTDGVKVFGLPDGDAFGWPGALFRLKERPTRVLGVARFVKNARDALAAAGPFDRVIAHWLVPSAYPVAVGAAPGAALEVVAHGSDVRLLLSAPRAVTNAILRRLLARAEAFRFVSSELLRDLAASLQPELAVLLEEKSRVEAPPLDVGRARERSEAKQRLGLLPDVRYVVIVARLVRQKRVGVALRAASLLPDVRIVVVGDGPELDRLHREFPSVRFVGKQPRERALDYIAAADLVLSVSRSEGAPSVVREARAVGTEVVSVSAGDVKRWAEADPGIWLVD